MKYTEIKPTIESFLSTLKLMAGDLHFNHIPLGSGPYTPSFGCMIYDRENNPIGQLQLVTKDDGGSPDPIQVSYCSVAKHTPIGFVLDSKWKYRNKMKLGIDYAVYARFRFTGTSKFQDFTQYWNDLKIGVNCQGRILGYQGS